MASFTRTSGDFKQVNNMDTGAYTVGSVNDYTSAVTVNSMGPKLEFATITFTGSSTTGAQVKAAIDTIQQQATVALYEFTTDTNDTLAVALYPVGSWGGDLTATGTGTLDAALTTACGENVSIAASATFTN